MKLNLKKGDKVKIKRATWDEHLVGTISTITEVKNGEIYVKGAEFGWEEGDDDSDYFELLTPKHNHKFYVGQKVRVIGNNHDIKHFLDIGSIATVIGIVGDNAKVRGASTFHGDRDCQQVVSLADLQPLEDPLLESIWGVQRDIARAVADSFCSDSSPATQTIGLPLSTISALDGAKIITKQRKGLMHQLTNRLKKALNPSLQAMYKLGWIDGDLEITEKGTRELVEFLLDQHEDEFGKKAIAEVKRLKKLEEQE